MDKLTLDHVVGLIDNITYDIDPQVIVCKLKVGEATIVGTSYCFHKSTHDPERGKESAYRDALNQLFSLEAYHQKRLRNLSYADKVKLMGGMVVDKFEDIPISDEEQAKAEELIQLQNRKSPANVFVTTN